MPNGEDRNWRRLITSVNGYRARYETWPSTIRLGQLELDDLRDNLFSPRRWARIAAKLRFVVEPDVAFVSEGHEGSSEYAPDVLARPDISAEDWLGVEPDWPIHGPRYELRAAFTVPGAPFGFKGSVKAWMEHCKDVAGAHLRQVGLRHVELPVKLVALFFLKPSSRPCDIDNMLKMLIDSLGAADLFKASRGGGHKTVWNTDDHWVYAIDAEKREDAEQPRVEVEIWTATGSN
jgi:Holliday junction resolvase RusA-like endonuclease